MRKQTNLFSKFQGARKDDTRVTQLVGVPIMVIIDTHGTNCSATTVLCNFGRFGARLGVTKIVFGRIASTTRCNFLHRAYTRTKIRYLNCLPCLRRTNLPPHRRTLALPTEGDLSRLLGRITRRLTRRMSVSGLLGLSAHVFPYACSLPCVSRARASV